MSWSNPLPNATPISIASNTAGTAYNILQAKHQDAANWATWAATLMEQQTTNISNTIGTDITTSYINPILAAIASAPAYSAGSLDFNNTEFTDSLLISLKARLNTDIQAYHTGLGATVETDMFARIVSRIDGERDKAYTELNNNLADRGFDVPPGALSAKQTEITNESSLRLADASTAILHESATLAANYNIQMLQVTGQVVDMLGKLHNDKLIRDFEVKKVSVLQALDGYRAQLALYETKGKLITQSAQLSIEALQRTMTVEVEAFKGVAQAAAQMVASSINSINVSSGFGFSGSESSGKAQSIQYSLSGKMAVDNNGAAVPPTFQPTT